MLRRFVLLLARIVGWIDEHDAPRPGEYNLDHRFFVCRPNIMGVLRRQRETEPGFNISPFEGSNFSPMAFPKLPLITVTTSA